MRLQARSLSHITAAMRLIRQYLTEFTLVLSWPSADESLFVDPIFRPAYRQKP